jgi:hypothetical protein
VRPDFAAEQAELRSLLKTQNEAQRWLEYAGQRCPMVPALLDAALLLYIFMPGLFGRR